MRVDSESALIKFINQLTSAGIDIPENLTFEFDSQELQIFFNELANHYLQPPFDGVNIFSPDNNITEFIYFGHKMKLKQQ